MRQMVQVHLQGCEITQFRLSSREDLRCGAQAYSSTFSQAGAEQHMSIEATIFQGPHAPARWALVVGLKSHGQCGHLEEARILEEGTRGIP